MKSLLFKEIKQRLIYSSTFISKSFARNITKKPGSINNNSYAKPERDEELITKFNREVNKKDSETQFFDVKSNKFTKMESNKGSPKNSNLLHSLADNLEKNYEQLVNKKKGGKDSEVDFSTGFTQDFYTKKKDMNVEREERGFNNKFNREDKREREDRGFNNKFDRNDRKFDREDRGDRGFNNKFDRNEKKFDREDRGDRGFNNKFEKKERSFDREDRGINNKFERNDRGDRGNREGFENKFERNDRRSSFNKYERDDNKELNRKYGNNKEEFDPAGYNQRKKKFVLEKEERKRSYEKGINSRDRVEDSEYNAFDRSFKLERGNRDQPAKFDRNINKYGNNENQRMNNLFVQEDKYSSNNIVNNNLNNNNKLRDNKFKKQMEKEQEDEHEDDSYLNENEDLSVAEEEFKKKKRELNRKNTNNETNYTSERREKPRKAREIKSEEEEILSGDEEADFEFEQKDSNKINLKRSSNSNNIKKDPSKNVLNENPDRFTFKNINSDSNPNLEFSKYDNLFGTHVVKAILSHKIRDVKELYILNSYKDNLNEKIAPLVELAQKNNVFVAYISRDKMDRLSGGKPHNGAIIKTFKREYKPIRKLDQVLIDSNNKKTTGNLILVLDQIVDPQNFGTIIRSSFYLGVDGIVVNKSNRPNLNSIIAKTSSGSSECIDIYSSKNLDKAIKELVSNNNKENKKLANWKVITAFVEEEKDVMIKGNPDVTELNENQKNEDKEDDNENKDSSEVEFLRTKLEVSELPIDSNDNVVLVLSSSSKHLFNNNKESNKEGNNSINNYHYETFIGSTDKEKSGLLGTSSFNFLDVVTSLNVSVSSGILISNIKSKLNNTKNKTISEEFNSKI